MAEYRDARKRRPVKVRSPVRARPGGRDTPPGGDVARPASVPGGPAAVPTIAGRQPVRRLAGGALPSPVTLVRRQAAGK